MNSLKIHFELFFTKQKKRNVTAIIHTLKKNFNATFNERCCFIDYIANINFQVRKFELEPFRHLYGVALNKRMKKKLLSQDNYLKKRKKNFFCSLLF